MAGDNPALVVRVVGNIEDLKKALIEGTDHIDRMVVAAIGLQTKLVLAEAAAQAAGTTMRGMADGIAKAGNATEAQVIALSKATAEFLAAKGAVAAAKDELAALKPVVDNTTGSVGGLRGALNAFDGVLAAMGVHLGPEIRGLGELGDAAGKTVTQLGAIATVGLAVGAAMGGWKIGRVIAEFFELDATIGQATAKLLGWGDAAGEAAGAKADVLARASKAVGYAVTDLTIAMGINEAALGTWRSNADISAAAVKGWQGEIAKVQSAGDLESLTADLKSHNFSLKDLADRYHLTVDALQFFTRETAAAAAAEKANSEIIKASNATKLHALQEEITAHKEAARVEAAQIAETTKLRDAYGKAVNAASHDTTKAQIDDAWLAADAQIAALEKTKKITIEDYGIIWATAKQTADNIIQKTLESDAYTKEHYQLIADKARIAYDFALAHATSYTNAEIQLLNEAARAAGENAAHWMQAAEKDIDAVNASFSASSWQAETDAWNASIMDVNTSLDGTIRDTQQLNAERAKGNSLDIGHAARDPEIMEYLHGGWSLENAEALKFARQWNFQAKLYSPTGNPETAPDPSERVPGYEAGGPTVAGPAILHGGEYVVPKDGALVYKNTDSTYHAYDASSAHRTLTPAEAAEQDQIEAMLTKASLAMNATIHQAELVRLAVIAANVAATTAANKAAADAGQGGVGPNAWGMQTNRAEWDRLNPGNTTADRAEFDRLNAQQAALFLANGKVVDAAQQKIIALMEPLTPAGFGKIASTIQPVTVTNAFTINVTQPFGTPTAIATAVNDALTKQLQQIRLLPAR